MGVRVRATAPPAGTPAKIRKQGGRFLELYVCSRIIMNGLALRVFVIAYANADQHGLLCVAPALREHAKSPWVSRL